MRPMETTGRTQFLDGLGPVVTPGVEPFGLYRPNGECSLCEVAELIRNAVEYCRHRGVSRLLINITELTGFSIPTVVDRFILAEEVAQVAQSEVAMALVVREEYIHPEKFGAGVAARFGFNVDVFSSETEALLWISSFNNPS